MINESKQNLLDFVMGNVEENEGNNKPFFDIPKLYQNNFKTKIDEITTNFNLSGTVQSKSNELIVAWGFRNDTSVSDYTIIILDSKFNIIKTIKKYDSGTEFERIIDIKVNNDGDFFMLENAFDNSWTRLVMLNDLTDYSTGNYKCELRKSYRLPTEYSAYSFERVDKSLTNAYYTFLGYDNAGNYGVLTLKINVGSSNEWRFTYKYIGSTCEVKDTLLVWSDTIMYTIYLNGNNGHYYEMFVYEIDGNIGATLLDIPFPQTGWLVTQIEAIKSIGSSNVYFVFTGVNDELTNRYARLYKLNYSNNNFDLITELDTPNSNGDTRAHFQTDKSNNLFLGLTNLFIGEQSTQKVTGQVYKITNGFNLDIVKTDTFEIDYYDGISDINMFTISQCFELNILTLQFNDYCIYTNMQLLNGGYNGQPFIDKNSINPYSATVYSDDDKILARSLYNKTINQNVTISTLEIPSQYLNGKTLNLKNLTSKNGNVLIKDENEFEKNIYENVYFNFINEINIIDKNNQNNLANDEASNEINYTMNNPENYDLKKLTKYKIIYADGTFEISKFNIIKNEKNYLIKFNVKLVKPASKIELISEDEMLTYLSISAYSLTLNKIYKISQKISIE